MNARWRWARLLPAVLLVMWLLATVTVWADPPGLMRYQARLTGNNGTPLAGNHSLTFAIYDALTGGSLMWNEGPRTVNLGSGNLDILLGEVTPLSSAIVTAPDRWLEIAVDGTVLAPRHRLSSVPYSLLADRLGTKTLPEIVTDNDARYPRLNNSNTFNGNQDFNGNVNANGRGSFNASTSDHVLAATQSGTGAGVHGSASDSTGMGVRGQSTAGSGGEGVKGEATGAQGKGVHGVASGGNGLGMHGEAPGSGGTGVKGEALGSQGTGVHGLASDPNGMGVRGQSTAGSGGEGVKGEATGAQGKGMHGLATGGNGIGVHGEAMGSGGAGMRGDATSGAGVHGKASDPNGIGGLFDNTAGGKILSAQVNGVEKLSVDGTGRLHAEGNLESAGSLMGSRMISNVASGTAPLQVASTTMVTNLNADMLDSMSSSDFAAATGSTVYLAKAGDTMTGALTLPQNGLLAGTSQLALSGGNVGIGTSTPAFTLEVNGTAAATTYTSGSISQPVQISGQSGTASGGQVQIRGGDSSNPGAGAGGVLISGGNATGGGGGNGGSIHLMPGTGTSAGRVGIGTLTPASTLDVNGAVHVEGNLESAGSLMGSRMISNVATGTAPLQVASTTMVTNLNADMLDGMSSSDFAAATGSTVYLAKAGDTMTGALTLPQNGLLAGTSQFALSGGNVGIGTSTPAFTLEVNGTAAATTYTSGSISQPVQISGQSGTASGGQVQIVAGNASNPGATAGGVIISGGHSIGGGGGAGGTISLMPGTGTTSGNVGIGTLTPASTLDVNGIAAATVFTSGSLALPAQVRGRDGTSSGGQVQIVAGNASNPGATAGGVIISGGHSIGGGGGAGGTISLMPGTGTTSGNVGIGTLSPASTLDVNGTASAMIFTSAGTGQPAQLLGRPGTATGGHAQVKGGDATDPGGIAGNVMIGGGNSPTGSGGNILLMPGGGTTPGKVGIGTSTPAFTLQVGGTAAADIFTSPGTNTQLRGSAGTMTGGQVSIAGGEASSAGGIAGNVLINGGNATGSGAGGNIVLVPGEGTTKGNVGIAASAPTNILTVVQSSPTDPIADAWTTYSSRRWKTDIQPLVGALDQTLRLRGVSFDWRTTGARDIGLIAEEVGEVVPEVVAYERNGQDARSIDYARLVAVLIEAIKEQQKQIQELREALRQLEAGR